MSRPSQNTITKILQILNREYPDASCSLNYTTPLELLVATILSAQCTDERVNQVTKDLFKKYRTTRDYAQTTQAQLEKDIQSTGFYKNKAKNIRQCCRQIDERFAGEVPKDINQLITLPGIGRKTANVVLGTAYGIPSGIVVDTHVARISQRLGLTENNDPEKIEEDLMRLIPEDEWIAFSHRMIKHGRKYCTARKPACDACPFTALCPKNGVEDVGSGDKVAKGKRVRKA